MGLRHGVEAWGWLSYRVGYEGVGEYGDGEAECVEEGILQVDGDIEALDNLYLDDDGTRTRRWGEG